MTARRSLSAVGVASLLAMVAMTSPALADDKAQCVASSEKAQQLRNAGKLSEAREQLVHCSRSECPKLIQQDCTQWMSEVLSAMPSVVPAAKDRKGRDIVDVRVSVDGKVVTEILDGKPIAIDPGVRAFHFETKGAPAVDEQVVVKPGEKNRIVTAKFATPDDSGGGGAGATGPSGSHAGTGAPADDASHPAGPPWAAIVVGGLGIVTLGVAGYFGLSGNADARDLRDGCAPKCPQADVDQVQDKYTLAGVTAGIGGALVITGVVLFILHGKGSSRTGANAPLLIRF
jgi:hypothetical protein